MSQPFNATNIPDQSGRTALITGSNTGIGWETAAVLAGKGARVLLACRSPKKGAAALERIQRLHPDADLAFVALDLGSLESVRKAAARIVGEARIDLLINNAGIMMPPREETADGFESQFGVNHLGHFALTGLLLEKLRETEGARVVTVSSGAHKAGRIQFDDIHAKKRYGRAERYGMSKLANLLFTHELWRRLAPAGHGTVALGCHPGVSETELSRNFPTWLKLLTPLMRPFTHPPQQGALPTLRAATDPEARGGEYYGPGGLLEMSGPPVRSEPSRASQNLETARRLWDLSIELTGVDPGI